MSWGYPRQTRRIKGERFKSMQDLVDWMEDGGWVWWRHKAYHPKVIASLQLRVVMSSVSATRDWEGFCRAELNPKYHGPHGDGRLLEQLDADFRFEKRRHDRAQREALTIFHLANGARTEP